MNSMGTSTAGTVLIVDDDQEVQALVGSGLESAGFQVSTVNTISTARTAMQNQEYDLFILDVRLPDGNGSLFAEEIRANSNAGIIIVTAYGDSIDRIIALELGADDYINKPFNLRELVARARAVSRRARRNNGQYSNTFASAQEFPQDQAEQVITFHGYTLLKSARSLTDSAGNAVSLTTLEFDALSILAVNKNIVLSRTEIYEGARLRKGDPGRMVDGLISRLRKKLFDDSEARMRIRTVHNRGYVLSE